MTFTLDYPSSDSMYNAFLNWIYLRNNNELVSPMAYGRVNNYLDFPNPRDIQSMVDPKVNQRQMV